MRFLRLSAKPLGAMETDVSDYHRNKRAIALLASIVLALVSGYQLFTTGSVSWLLFGTLVICVLAALGSHLVARAVRATTGKSHW